MTFVILVILVILRYEATGSWSIASSIYTLFLYKNVYVGGTEAESARNCSEMIFLFQFGKQDGGAESHFKTFSNCTCTQVMKMLGPDWICATVDYIVNVSETIVYWIFIRISIAMYSTLDRTIED